MTNYLFENTNEYSDLCGERIFVQCDNYYKALEILEEILEREFIVSDWEYCGEYTDGEAEMIGYDTY